MDSSGGLVEPDRFDDVVLKLTTGVGRRRILGALSLLGVGAFATLADADAKKKKKKKKKGKKDNTCAKGLTRCWSYDPCRDLQNDPENCGTCDTYCASGEQCIGGVCRIPCEPNACHVATFGGDLSLYRITRAADGTIIATTRDNQVAYFNPNGSLIKMIGEYGTEPGEFDYPEGVAVGPNGEVYVADTGNDRIQVLRPNGVIDLIPADYPEVLAVRPSGAIYVEVSGRVARINELGDVLYQWGPDGTNSEDFYTITDMAIGPDGDIYVLDGYVGRISRYSDDGNGTVALKWAVGNVGADPGELDDAEGLAVSGNEVFVADSGNSRIQVYDATSGSYRLHWNLRDEYAGTMVPDGITVDSSGHVYITDGDIYVYERRS